MSTISDRPIALRRTTESLSGGTRVDFVGAGVENGTVVVAWRGKKFTTDADNLVYLRKRELELPGADLRRRMALAFGTN